MRIEERTGTVPQDRDWRVIDEDCECCTRVEVDGEPLFYVATVEKAALAAKLLENE